MEAMENSQPRSHKGVVIVPGWVVKSNRKLLDKMTGEHANVYVGMAALLGEDGYCMDSTEESIELEPGIFAKLMIQGYKFLSGHALGKTLSVLATELRQPDNPIYAAAQTLAEENESDASYENKVKAAIVILVRNATERFIRQHLRVMFQAAGMEIQHGAPKREPADELIGVGHDLVTIAMSQMVGVWIEIASAPIEVVSKKPGE